MIRIMALHCSCSTLQVSVTSRPLHLLSSTFGHRFHHQHSGWMHLCQRYMRTYSPSTYSHWRLFCVRHCSTDNNKPNKATPTLRPIPKVGTKDDSTPVPFHFDDYGVGTVRNPIGITPEDQRKFYFHGPGRYLVVLVGVAIIIAIDSFFGTYVPNRSMVVGEQKESPLFQPVKIVMETNCPYGNVLKVFFKYYGITHIVTEHVPDFLGSIHMDRLGLQYVDMETKKLPRISVAGFVMNDSSFILSILQSYFSVGGRDTLWQILDRYPFVVYDDCIWARERAPLETLRRFIANCRKYSMLTNDDTLENLISKSLPNVAEVTEEEEMRHWADTVLADHICMALHGTVSTSLKSCRKFMDEQNWSSGYSTIGSVTLVYLDLFTYAVSMYRRSVKLKQKYKVDNCQDALQQQFQKWLGYVEKSDKRKEGSLHLSEMTVYGLTNQYENHDTIKELIGGDQRLDSWYCEVQKLIETSAGFGFLNLEQLENNWVNHKDKKRDKDFVSKRSLEKIRQNVEEMEIKVAKATNTQAYDSGSRQTREGY